MPAVSQSSQQCGHPVRSDQGGLRFQLTTARLRTVVLAESSLLGWVVVCVITDNVADQQGVRQTVRNVELRTQLVRHRVANTQEGVRKRDTAMVAAL